MVNAQADAQLRSAESARHTDTKPDEEMSVQAKQCIYSKPDISTGHHITKAISGEQHD